MSRKTLVLCFVLLLTQSSAYAAQLYAVTDLGTLGGGTSFGTALNDHGHAVGYSLDSSGNTRAFYWTPGGGLQNLGIIGTGTSQALDINNNEHIVGQTGGKAFRWTIGTGMVLIDAANNGSANGLNESDAVIGTRVINPPSPISQGVNRILTWSAANVVTSPYPAFNSQGVAINDPSQFVGTLPVSGYYSPGSGLTTVFGNLRPTDLNDNRQIVGSLAGIAALLDLDSSTTTSLGKLSPSDSSSQALGINQAGTIVGVSQGSGGFVTDEALTLVSLTDSLYPSFAAWTILTATDINNNGQIIGLGDLAGVQHAVILTPVPEPSSLELVCAAMGIVTFFTFLRRYQSAAH